MFCSHNKKRPNNVVIGRTYEHKVLDMVEMGVLDATSIEDVVGSL
jgi:ribosome production factor 2